MSVELHEGRTKPKPFVSTTSSFVPASALSGARLSVPSAPRVKVMVSALSRRPQLWLPPPSRRPVTLTVLQAPSPFSASAVKKPLPVQSLSRQFVPPRQVSAVCVKQELAGESPAPPSCLRVPPLGEAQRVGAAPTNGDPCFSQVPTPVAPEEPDS